MIDATAVKPIVAKAVALIGRQPGVRNLGSNTIAKVVPAAVLICLGSGKSFYRVSHSTLRWSSRVKGLNEGRHLVVAKTSDHLVSSPK